jgi:hypothetical protein
MQLGRLDETFHPIAVPRGQFFQQKDPRQQRHIFTNSGPAHLKRGGEFGYLYVVHLLIPGQK